MERALVSGGEDDGWNGRVYVRVSIDRVWRTTVRSAFDILDLVYVSVGSMEKDGKVSMVIAGSRKQEAER